MRIAVIDNDENLLDVFERNIQEISSEKGLKIEVDKFTYPQDLINQMTQYEVIFIDIMMPDMNGIELSEKLALKVGSNPLPLIVFITSKENLVFEAIKVHPFGFIRKRLLAEELKECIDDIEYKISRIMEYRDGVKVSIKGPRKKRVISLDEIMYAEKVEHYIKYTLRYETISERLTMRECAKKLEQHGFMRIHAGFIVNPKYITLIEPNYVQMENGTKINISRKYKSDIQGKYMR